MKFKYEYLWDELLEYKSIKINDVLVKKAGEGFWFLVVEDVNEFITARWGISDFNGHVAFIKNYQKTYDEKKLKQAGVRQAPDTVRSNILEQLINSCDQGESN